MSSPRERPILFSGEMARAILAGTKTRTRRPITDLRNAAPRAATITAESIAHRMQWPFGVPGDRLWVRETWGSADRFYRSVELDTPEVVAYRADKSAIQWSAEPPRQIPAYDLASWNWERVKWRPSIHMPRWASRISLDVAAVRVERLQDITEEAARAEGVTLLPSFMRDTPRQWRDSFRAAWEEIYGRDSWSANPWVWVVEFRRVEVTPCASA